MKVSIKRKNQDKYSLSFTFQGKRYHYDREFSRNRYGTITGSEDIVLNPIIQRYLGLIYREAKNLKPKGFKVIDITGIIDN